MSAMCQQRVPTCKILWTCILSHSFAKPYFFMLISPSLELHTMSNDDLYVPYVKIFPTPPSSLESTRIDCRNWSEVEFTQLCSLISPWLKLCMTSNYHRWICHIAKFLPHFTICPTVVGVAGSKVC